MAKKYQMAFDAKAIIKDQSLLRHEDIKQHILILPELAAYIPPLLPDEYNQLENNIKQNGCREALLVWETTGNHVSEIETDDTIYVLIDGHNRYAICKKHAIDFKVHIMSFPSIEEVKFFMIDNQLGRRNLAPEQVSYLRGLRYLREKKEKGKYNREEQKGQNVPFGIETAIDGENEVELGTQQSTAHRLGQQFNVSEKTIKRDSTYAQGLEKLDPAFKQEILSGKTKVEKALVQQLGQTSVNIDPVRNTTELEYVLQKKKANSDSKKLSDPESNEPNKQLRKKLQSLVSQLDTKKIDVKQLCKDIIECARELQKQS